MEDMNSFLSFPSPGQDMAIRRFCAARVEQQQLGEWEEALNEMELWSPSDTSVNALLASMDLEEEEDFIESFFNMDCYNEEGASSELKPSCPIPCPVFESNLDELFIMKNNSCDDVPMILQGDDFETCFSFEDYGVVSQVAPSLSAEQIMSHGVDQGLHLVHLLLACAEAVGCRDGNLADSVLNQVWGSVNPSGDSLQRVSFCFAMGLKSRLSLLHNVGANGTFTNAAVDVPMVSREERMEAFQFLYQTTPYIAFGFMAANEAIGQASQGKHSIHVIDLGMEHVLQWPSLIRTLASRPEGPPKLRITGIIGDHVNASELQARMNVVINDARLLGMKLEFRVITDPMTPALFTSENLHLGGDGEALVFNSMMHLHKYVKESRGSLKLILQAIRKLGPTLLTLVEQDANHNGPFFLGRFLESLHYYSAVFDSLEASLPRNSPQRIKIERLHFAEEIRNVVAFEGTDRIERHERADQWRRQLSRAGFQVVGLKCMSQARMMLSVYGCDGYTLASEKGCLHLGWKGRPIMLASAWKVHQVSSS